MIHLSNIKIPDKKSEFKEDLLIKKEFKLKYLSDFYEIIIGKTKNNIIIQSTYYKLKLNLEQLSNLTNIIFKSIDDSFEFIENIFNQNKSYIKKISLDEIILIIKTYDIIKGKEKEIELYLIINFDKNDIIKDLINKYIVMEKEIKELKEGKKKLKEENDKLNQNIDDLKLEIISMNSEIEILQNQVMTITNMINQINQQINEFNNLKEDLNAIKIKINCLSISYDSLNLNNQSPIYSNQYVFNNFNQIILQAYFRYEKMPPIRIMFTKNEKVSTIIKRFRNMTDWYDDKLKFIFNGKNLNQNLTAEELDLNNNSNIFVIKTKI